MWVWVKVTKTLIRLAPLDLSLHSQVLSDWLVFFPAGLACFLQPGCYDWLPDRACCCSCVDPLSSETAHIQVQVMDRHVCVCARVWMQPWGYFLYSFNFILIIYWEDLAPFVACREDDFCNNNYFLSSIILYARRQNMRRFLTWINISSLTVCTFLGKYSWTTYLPQGYVFHLCPFLCLVILLVCDQNCTKTVEWISTKHGWRMRLSPE